MVNQKLAGTNKFLYTYNTSISLEQDLEVQPAPYQ